MEPARGRPRQCPTGVLGDGDARGCHGRPAWWEPATTRDPFPEGPPGEWPDPEPDDDETDEDLPPERPTVDEQEGTEASESAAAANPLERRADGKVYCCDTLGWVDEATAFDHRWDTSRPLEEYLSERASAWDDVKPGE